jgi:hypothetical protein
VVVAGEGELKAEAEQGMAVAAVAGVVAFRE